MNISGATTTEAIITGLTPSTLYTIQVATVNSGGIGEYTRNTISALTFGEYFPIYFIMVYYKHTLFPFSDSSSDSSSDVCRVRNTHNYISQLEQCWFSGQQLSIAVGE